MAHGFRFLKNAICFCHVLFLVSEAAINRTMRSFRYCRASRTPIVTNPNISLNIIRDGQSKRPFNASGNNSVQYFHLLREMQADQSMKELLSVGLQKMCHLTACLIRGIDIQTNCMHSHLLLREVGVLYRTQSTCF